MKRNTKFLIGLAAAIITFGSLTLAFGPKRTHWRNHHNGWHGAQHHERHSCGDETQKDKS